MMPRMINLNLAKINPYHRLARHTSTLEVLNIRCTSTEDSINLHQKFMYVILHESYGSGHEEEEVSTKKLGCLIPLPFLGPYWDYSPCKE